MNIDPIPTASDTMKAMLRLLRSVAPGNVLGIAAEDELLPLTEGALRGDRHDTRSLLVALGPHLLRVVRRVLGAGHPDVQDVTQECAAEVINALPRFRRESSVKHFACRVSLQVCLNVRRRHSASKRGPVPSDAVDADTVAAPDLSPDEQLALRASLRILRDLCDELPPAQSEVLALHCILGHTVNEVAAVCNAPVETIRSRLRLAKQALLARALANRELREYLEGPV